MIVLSDDEEIDDLELNGLKIIQNKNFFKFGMDSVLLADFAKRINKNSKVLDIGTGTGIISILLCGKTEVKDITGLEIQEELANIAKRNVELNNLQNRIKILVGDIKNITETYVNNYFDVIVTNPPYMKAKTGKQNENINKFISRHEVKCTLEDILKSSYSVLRDKGEFYMVHRSERLTEILSLMRAYKIEPKEIRLVYSNSCSESNLVLIKGIKNANEFLKVLPPLIVYEEGGNYTDEILKIYGKKKETD